MKERRLAAGKNLIHGFVAFIIFLWFYESLKEYRWFNPDGNGLISILFPFHDPLEMLIRILFFSLLLIFVSVLSGMYTKLSESEKIAKENENNLKITFNSIADAIIETDNDGKITRMNPIAEKLTGWTIDQAKGIILSEVFKIINAETRDVCDDLVEKVISSGKIIDLKRSTVLISKDGGEYQIADSAAPIIDAEGNINGVVLVFRDVNEENNLQKKVAESEEKYRALFESSMDAIILLDPDGGYLDCNPAALKMFAISSKNNLYSLNFAALSPKYQPDGSLSEDRARSIISKTFEEGWSSFEWTHKGVNGREFPATVLATRLDVGGRTIIQGTIRDVTDRKKIEDDLANQNRRYYTLLQNLNGLVYRCKNDRNWTMSFLSDGCFALTGYKPEDLLENGKLSYNDIIMPKYHDYIWELWQKHLKNHESVETEYEIKTASGEIKWVWEKGRGIFDEDGQLLCLEGFITDITDRKKAEIALSESEERFRAAFDSAQDCVLIWDKDYNYLYANQAAIDHVGTTPDKVIGKNLTDGLGHVPDFMHLWISRVDRVFETGERLRVQDEQEMQGKLYFIDSIFSPIRDSDGKVISVCVVYRDITDLKRAESELRNLRNYLSNIINSMPSILIGVDAEAKVTQWNNTAEQRTGITAKDAQGKKLIDVFPQMELEMEKIIESIRTSETKSAQKRPRRLDGGTCYEDVTVYPLITNGVEGAVIRIDDVTEQVRLEEIMIQSEKMLSVGGLAAGMAHEINNPLAGMMQTAKVIESRLGEKMDIPANRKAAQEAGTSMEAIRKYMEARGIPHMLSTLNESGQRVAVIVNNMLSFARKSDVKITYHSICDLLDKTLELVATDYDLKQHYDFKLIEIIKEYEDNLPLVSCDGSKIQQVFMNILRNGAQAMHEAGTEKSRFIIRTFFEKNREMVCVEFEDNGPGMDEVTRKRLFEPFFTTKTIGKGTGLGLSVSYFIITENHRGEMEVESQPGSGAKFIIRLPVEAAGE